MGGRQALIGELKQFKKELNRAIGVNKLILFGSFAEGTEGKDSDVDLIIVSEKFGEHDFFRRAALAYRYWKARKPVDFLCYTPKEFAELSGRVTIVSNALKNGVAI